MLMMMLVACIAFCPKTGERYSLLEYVLREQEQVHGKMRRYTSPDEHAFYPGMMLHFKKVWA